MMFLSSSCHMDSNPCCVLAAPSTIGLFRLAIPLQREPLEIGMERTARSTLSPEACADGAPPLEKHSSPAMLQHERRLDTLPPKSAPILLNSLRGISRRCRML